MSRLKKIFKIFDKNEKRKFIFILILSVLGAFLEMVGISLFIPLIAILLGESINFGGSKFLDDYMNLINQFNYDNILFIAVVALVLVFLTKNIYLFFLHYYNNKFINDIGSKISKKVFKKYLNNNINFFIKKNSNELLNNCIYVVDGFKDTLSNIILVFSELLVLFGIFLLLVIIEPRGFLLSFIFIFFFGIMAYFLSGKTLERWGQQIINFEKQRYLHLSQAFRAIREIKVFKKINFFFQKYVEPNNKRFQVSIWKATFTGLPKYFIEFLFVITLSSLLIFLNYLGKSNQDIIIIMGLYAVATIRIMPSLNRILSSFQTFKFGKKSIDIIYDEINQNFYQEIQNKDISNNNFDLNKKEVIDFQKVSFKFEDNRKKIFEDLNLKIYKNEFVAIIGETGSGKSTMINLMLGLLKCESGEINLNYKKVGLVPQNPYLIDDTIKENIALGIEKKLINEKKIDDCIYQVQLQNLILSLPKGIDTIVGENGVKFSGGEIQRLSIARALYVAPDIIVLDEPTNSLDEKTEKKIMEILKNLSKNHTIILVTHNLANINFCDKIIELGKHEVNIKKIERNQ
mgnify:CR=1 FL=1